MTSVLTLPPTKEKIIAQSVCAKLNQLKTSSGNVAARKALTIILSRLSETEDKKLVDAIEIELRRCQSEIVA